jgi:hypothetical protein
MVSGVFCAISLRIIQILPHPATIVFKFMNVLDFSMWFYQRACCIENEKHH